MAAAAAAHRATRQGRARARRRGRPAHSGDGESHGSPRHPDDIRADPARRAAGQDLRRGAGALRALPAAVVWIGVGAAFCVQTLVAVTAGSSRHCCRHWVHLSSLRRSSWIGAVRAAAHGARRRGCGEGAGGGVLRQGPRRTQTVWRAIGASFLVLFAAEWGDLSQLLTMSRSRARTTRSRCSSAPGRRCCCLGARGARRAGAAALPEAVACCTTSAPRCARCSP